MNNQIWGKLTGMVMEADVDLGPGADHEARGVGVVYLKTKKRSVETDLRGFKTG